MNARQTHLTDVSRPAGKTTPPPGRVAVDAAAETEARVRLSEAQRRCLTCAAHGLDYRETAVLLYMSRHTVKAHLTQTRRLLAAKNTAHAVAVALRLGLIT